MTEPSEGRPRWQSIAPNTWTRLEADPDTEICHTGPGTMLVSTRRAPKADRPAVPIMLVQDGVPDVDVTSAQRWEKPDGSVFALVTWEEGGLK